MNTDISKRWLPALHQPTIERQQLIETLQLALQHKLTLIAAPPGYGKTTIAAQFARQTTVPAAWHTVEARERDFPNLFSHSIKALASLVPDIEAITPLPGATVVETAGLVTEHFRSSESGDSLYVVDDIHHLIGSPDAESWLPALILGLPGTCHIILIGRAFPKLPLMELAARREVLALGQEQLRFSFQETCDLAQQLGVSASVPDIERIYSQLDGWAAGIVLAFQPLPREVETALFRGEQGPEALFDALAEVMLQTQDDAVQDFLLASSTLTRITPTLCQDILQTPDSLKHLSTALSQNLFISEVSGGFVYHALFRDFLQHYLRTHDYARFSELHHRAAVWFEQNNHLDEAFDHYLRAEQLQEAAAIAQRAAQVYVAQGKIETVLYWHHELERVEVECPQLLFTCAAIYSDRYQFDFADTAAARAAQGFQECQDEPGLLKVNLLQASIDNLRGEHRRAIHRTEDLIRRFDLPDNLRGYGFYILGIAYFNLGDNSHALQQLEAALPLYRATNDAYALSQLLFTLEVLYIRIGRFELGAAYLQEALAIRRAFGKAAGLVMPLNNLGYEYHLLGQYQEALSTFQEALEVARRLADRRVESHILGSMADLQRDRGAFDEAGSLYDQALHQIGANEPSLRCGTLVSFSTLLRWQGKHEDALALAEEAAALADQHGLMFEQFKARLSLWAVRLHRGEVAAARQELKDLAETFYQQQAQTRWAQTLALCAFAALTQGDTSAARQYLKLASERASHEANLQPCIAEIVHTPRLKTFVEAQSSRYPRINSGMKRLQTSHLETLSEGASPRQTQPVPTYSLRIWLLGQERVERDGAPVPVSAWRAADARELFFYLLLKGSATREQLGLVLWADSSNKQVRMKFHETLRRVRHAVGKNTVLFENELYFINPNLDIWCDAIEFESLVQEARLTSPLRAHTETILRRAVDLYAGELLTSVDETWTVSHREELHEMYLEVLLTLGTCVRIRGDFQEAIVTFQRALDLDPYREDIYREIFTCYAALGERPLIRQLVDKLTQLLEADLGVAPSAQTLTLARSLLNERHASPDSGITPSI